MIQWLVRAITVCFKSKAQLIAENLCLRQQLVILKRRQPRPCLRDTDRRFWILACRWFAGRGEALKWYRQAAAQGLAIAQTNIGVMYYKGLGVNQDFIQAYAWHGIAVANGVTDAIQMRNYLETQLIPNELEEARQLTRELWGKYKNSDPNASSLYRTEPQHK